MDLLQVYWPIVALGVAAFAVVAGVVTLLAIYHKSLISAAREARKKAFNRETLFWVVNITFMAFSAYHAAPFYSSVSSNVLGMDWFAPFVGITAALVLDALVIVFQNARKRAGYKHDRKRMSMYTRYIAACCGLNSVANLYTNYQHFDASNYTNFWSWAIMIAPVFLSLFPLFIVGMSNALEEMSSSSALDTLDVDKFKEDEEKRVGMLEEMAAFQDREVQADRRLIEIDKMRKENDRLRKGKQLKAKRVSRLGAWFWRVPLQEDYAKALERVTQEQTEERQKIVADLVAKYDAQIVALTEQIASLNASLLANKSRRRTVTTSNAPASQTPSQFPTQERHTEEIPTVGNSDASSDANTEQKQPTPLFNKRNRKAEGTALRKVRNIVKKYPTLGPTEIARRAQISRSYASQLREQVLKEA